MSTTAGGGGLPGWLRERAPVDPATLQALTNEPVPRHMKRWWFALGGTPAYLFVVQIVTGILLAFHYEASAGRAWESVRYITEDAAFGWYIRSLHKWAATGMIAAVVLHQMRVFFTGAYRRPRELNWMVGCGLLFATLSTGFTGYSLVFEQLSYWGATVGANIAESVPVIGGVVKRAMLGGDEYGPRTLSRFYVLHAAILPGTIALLVAIHIGLVRTLGVTELEFIDEVEDDEPKHFNFFPDHLYTELIVGLTLMIILSALATALPATMGPQANPLITPEVIKPEWFFYVAFRWLKLFSGTAAVLSMGLIVLTMVLWPFIDRFLRRKTGFADPSFWIGVAAVLVIVGMTVWEGAVAH